MIDFVNGKITNTDTDSSHRKEQTKEGFIDIHCHCLPGLDDGPATLNEALILCQQMSNDGITTAIATPHQLGRFEGLNKAVHVRDAVKNLNKLLTDRDIPINILPGGEVRVDQGLCHLLESDEILTLADGGRYLLLELPNEIFIDIEPLIQELASIGIQSIISHAERISQLIQQPKILNRWLEHSATLQITASSLTRGFGSEFQRNALQLLCSGSVSFIATDSHNTDYRKPKMRAAFGFISKNLGQNIAHLLCIENPSRVLDGRDILTVSTLNRREVDK